MCVWVQIELIGECVVNFNFCKNFCCSNTAVFTVLYSEYRERASRNQLEWVASGIHSGIVQFSNTNPFSHCIKSFNDDIVYWEPLTENPMPFQTLLSASCSWFKGLNNCFCDMKPENIMTLTCIWLLSRIFGNSLDASTYCTTVIACSTCIEYRRSGHLVYSSC